MNRKFFPRISLAICLGWLGAVVWASFFSYEFSYSPIVKDKNLNVLSVRVAQDEQWRFKLQNDLPDRYIKALCTYEDRNYYRHIGIDPVGLIRAVYLNLKNHKVVSGGSTLTMQLARLMLKSNSRNFLNKIKEMYLSVGLEFCYSKNQLLRHYGEMAPFGSNIIGIEAAMFKYYNKYTKDISWAEAAMLAVLPNQPSWIHVAKNRSRLLTKRNELLKTLMLKRIINEEEYELALLEPLPDKPDKVNRRAPHLLDYLVRQYPHESVFHTTINGELQTKVSEICNRYHQFYKQNNINNIAVLVVDNNNQNIISYVGNLLSDSLVSENGEVDMIFAKRSSGSILKPLLMASALENGLITQRSLLPDIPTVINGFRPENFSRQYSGACTAQELIRYSLNIPSVLLLKNYGIPRFYDDLRKMGIKTLFRQPMDYGLSLILGGAEVTMWDIATVYSHLAFDLSHYHHFNQKYLQSDSFHLRILQSDSLKSKDLTKSSSIYSAGTISIMFDAMRNPMAAYSTQENSRQRPHVAWKTGTSFGYKDAWCIGVTPDYTICVWVGNSSGLSRPGLIGLETAAPVLQDILNELTQSNQWIIPYDNFVEIPICSASGYIAGPSCEKIDTIYCSKNSINVKSCPHHKIIFVDQKEQYQVNAECELNAKEKKYFVLPPLIAHFYQHTHSGYIKEPSFRPDCADVQVLQSGQLDFIYPNEFTTVLIPVDLDNKKNICIFKAVHKEKNAYISWFLDDQFIEQTHGNHEVKCLPQPGSHVLSIIDELGNSKMVKFKVVR